MRSLFAKLFLSILLATMLSLGGFAFITAISFTGTRQEAPFSRMARFLAEEAERSYLQGGAPALRDFVGRVRASFQGDVVVTDAGGRDVLTGDQRSELLRRGRGRSFFPFVRGRRVVIARPSEDGRYWIFLMMPGARLGRWFARQQFLWVIVASLLIAFLLARHLSSPLRQLQAVVERFGRGDFSARTHATRRDEFGALSRTFDRMADHIQRLRESERRLLLDISHELRSPLARMGLAVELAEGGDAAPALDRIRKEADRLNALVSELLEITRAESDRSSLRIGPVRLDELLRGIVDDARLEADARHVGVEMAEGPALELRADAALLRRAIENVVRNAIRYAPEGTAVEVSVRAAAATAAVAVRDRGPGVPADQLPRIFDPFYRVETDRSRATGGVGLGLAIARRAIELHGGSMQARNAAPGLLVEITLPLN